MYLDVEKDGETHTMHEKGGISMHCGSHLHCLRTVGDVAVEEKNIFLLVVCLKTLSVYTIELYYVVNTEFKWTR
jgi:hypothetical protein